MKRINITKINFIFYLFLLLIAIFCCYHKTFAVEKSEKITLVSNINNVYNNVTNIYTYKLTTMWLIYTHLGKIIS